MPPQKKYKDGVRVNGLQRPYNVLQLLAFALFPIFWGSFLGLTLHFLPYILRIVIGSISAVLAVVVGVAAYECMLCDPADPNCAIQHNPNDDDGLPQLPAGETRYCHQCRQHVLKSSLHCPDCDKCVAKYDHHCKWLNNCVGEKNYKQFFVLLSTTTVFVGVQLGVALYIVVLYARDDSKDLYDDRLQEYAGNLSDRVKTVVIVVIAALTVLLFCITVLLVHLLGFHINLWRLNKTTYQFVVDQRKHYAAKRRKKKGQEAATKNAATNKKPTEIELPSHQAVVETDVENQLEAATV